jgi:FKBP-type peptidyl-prolyl cis-trans isomerase FklB
MNLQDRLKAMFEKSTEDQESFLQENAKKEGVITLPSGLQYLVLINGEGEKPGPRSMVTVHYEGSLINGKVFDSSYKRGEPASFGVYQVISGWTEALQLMPVGSKWRLFIPSALGYGTRGSGGSIPPNSTLIFDVELLGKR